MEDENFSQLHHVNWGEVVLVYNHMHKFKHIVCEHCKVGFSAILYYAGLTNPVSYCFDLIWFERLLHASGYNTILVLPLVEEYIIHLLVNIYIYKYIYIYNV